jgi:ribose transport system permease protein
VTDTHPATQVEAADHDVPPDRLDSAGEPRRRPSLGFDRFSGLYLWALFIVVFGLWTPDLFLTTNTLHLVAGQQAVAAILALAVLTPLACGAYDLSIGATINLSAVVVAVLQTQQGLGMWPAIVVSVLVGVAIGALNAVIVVRLKVNSFIATLGVATIIGAVQSIISNGSQPYPPSDPAWADLTQSTIAGFQVIVLYLLVIAIVLWWMLQRTPAGRYIYAVGSNAEAARLSGVSTGRWTAFSLVLSGGLSALAGVFYSSLNGPSLTFGATLLLPAYAAVFLGSTQFVPGRFNVLGTVLAIYVLATGVQGLQYVTSLQWLNDMFNGVALIVAVSFAVSRQGRVRRSLSATRRGGRRRRTPTPAEANVAQRGTEEGPR